MFYLLEDNRIIKDSKNFSHICCYENRKSFLYKVFSDKEYGKNRKIGKLKKQSENVFDLIEEGDLIKDENRLYEVSEISDGKNDNGRKSAISQPGMFKHWEWEIEAIYKLNSNGDYIKAWVKKSVRLPWVKRFTLQ